MFTRVTPVIRAVVESIATTDMCRNGQFQKFCPCHQMCSRSGEPGIGWGLNLNLTVQQEVVNAFPPITLAAQVFSLIGFSKEDFRASYRHTI